MRVKSTRAFIALFVLLTAAWAFAETDLSGTWKAKTISARGSSEQTMTLKQSGDSFTGEMVNSAGVKETIKDGTVKGSDISFKVERKQASGEMSDVEYSGTVTGTEMKGSFVGASGAKVEWTATKQ